MVIHTCDILLALDSMDISEDNFNFSYLSPIRESCKSKPLKFAQGINCSIKNSELKVMKLS